MNEILFIVLIIVGYLMGSICSAIIVSKIFSLPDPQKEGSKNPGATNVLRLAGKKYAIQVIVFDMLKGVVPVLIAKALGLSPLTVACTALAAVLGHMYPVFFEFKGGKGVATAMGALLALHFMLGVAVIATWLLVANFSRYSSLASMSSMVAMPLYAMLMQVAPSAFPPLFFMMLFILYQHRNNISRLTDGTEPKIKLKKQEGQPTEAILTETEVVEVKAEKPKASPKKKTAAKKTTAETKTTTAKKSTAKKTAGTSQKKAATGTKSSTSSTAKKTTAATKKASTAKKTSTTKKTETKKTTATKEDKKSS